MVGDQLLRAYDRKRSRHVEFSSAIKGISGMLHGTPTERAKGESACESFYSNLFVHNLVFFRAADLKEDDILDLEEVEATVAGHIELFSIALTLVVKYSVNALKTASLTKGSSSSLPPKSIEKRLDPLTLSFYRLG